MRRIAAEMGGIEVIVAEEVKTAEQGEVIGLFLEEKIPRGMTMAETIAEIRRQGGLVYVPHPFDRMHSVPDYEHLLDMVDEIDILEVPETLQGLIAARLDCYFGSGSRRRRPQIGGMIDQRRSAFLDRERLFPHPQMRSGRFAPVSRAHVLGDDLAVFGETYGAQQRDAEQQKYRVRF